MTAPNTKEALDLVSHFTDNTETLDFYCAVAGTAETLVNAAIAEERERCAKIAERMTCVYGAPRFATEGFNLATASIAREIRNTDSGCEPPQAKPPCTFCGHTSCNSIDCYARQAFVDRDREDPPQTELVVPARLYREAIETLRDKFALAALAGFGTGVAADRTAQLCYAQADAMIEARKKS